MERDDNKHDVERIDKDQDNGTNLVAELVRLINEKESLKTKNDELQEKIDYLSQQLLQANKFYRAVDAHFKDMGYDLTKLGKQVKAADFNIRYK